MPPPSAPEVEIVEVEDDDSKKDKSSDPLKCFLFDARFVPERGGVACLIKVMSGTLNNDKIKQLMSYQTKKRYEIY